MAARQESKVTRLDLRIPNDIYTQVEEIAKANNEPTHHITGNIILTPTLVKLIRLGIRSLSDNYPALADIPISSGQVSDNLLKRMDSFASAHRLTVVEGELSALKKLVAELSGNTVVAASVPDTISDVTETGTISDSVPAKISNDPEVALSPDNVSDTSETTENHTTQSPSSQAETISWTDFYRMIDEVLPSDLKQNKANSDHAIALAVEKGFDGWRYDSRVKNFIKP
jgi:hypothetical protein